MSTGYILEEYVSSLGAVSLGSELPAGAVGLYANCPYFPRTYPWQSAYHVKRTTGKEKYISVYAAFVGPTRRINLNSARVDVRRL